MSRSPAGRRRLERAFAISIALHVLLLSLVVGRLALPIGSGIATDAARATETTTIAFLTLERRVKRSLPAAVAPGYVFAPVRRDVFVRQQTLHRVPAKSAAAASSSRAPRPPQAHQAAVAALARGNAARPPAAAAAAPAQVADHFASEQSQPATAARAVPGVTVAAPATAAPTSAPATPVAPPPAPARRQVAVTGIDVPPGGWGQSFERPLVADDAALASLRARYHASGAVSVDVDETGRALRVNVPSDTPEDVRAELERRLLELRYVPAECNGLRCSGTVELDI